MGRDSLPRSWMGESGQQNFIFEGEIDFGYLRVQPRYYLLILVSLRRSFPDSAITFHLASVHGL